MLYIIIKQDSMTSFVVIGLAFTQFPGPENHVISRSIGVWNKE